MTSLLRILLLVPLILCQMLASAANLNIATDEKVDSAKRILTGADAYRWVAEHLDSLSDSYPQSRLSTPSKTSCSSSSTLVR